VITIPPWLLRDVADDDDDVAWSVVVSSVFVDWTSVVHDVFAIEVEDAGSDEEAGDDEDVVDTGAHFFARAPCVMLSHVMTWRQAGHDHA